MGRSMVWRCRLPRQEALEMEATREEDGLQREANHRKSNGEHALEMQAKEAQRKRKGEKALEMQCQRNSNSGESTV